MPMKCATTLEEVRWLAAPLAAGKQRCLTVVEEDARHPRYLCAPSVT